MSRSWRPFGSSSGQLPAGLIATRAVTTFAGLVGSIGSGSNALFNYPYSVTNDGAGGLFVGDLDNYMVRKFIIASQVVTTVVRSPSNLGVVLGPLPGGVNEPTGLAFVPAQGLFIVRPTRERHSRRSVLICRQGPQHICPFGNPHEQVPGAVVLVCERFAGTACGTASRASS